MKSYGDKVVKTRVYATSLVLVGRYWKKRLGRSQVAVTILVNLGETHFVSNGLLA